MNNRDLKEVYDELLWRAVLVRGWMGLLGNVCRPCQHYPDRIEPMIEEIDAIIDTVETLKK